MRNFLKNAFVYALNALAKNCALRRGEWMKKQLAINERGLRVGEDHQNAKLTNEEVETIRELHREGLSYKTLAKKFEVSKSLVAQVCRFERRAEVATNWKTVHVPER